MQCQNLWRLLYFHPRYEHHVGRRRVRKGYRFSASCKPPQISQWNLLRSHNISLALNWRKHALTLEFCSISILKSKNTSSLVVIFSQVRHFVSEVNIPSNNSCTQRAL